MLTKADWRKIVAVLAVLVLPLLVIGLSLTGLDAAANQVSIPGARSELHPVAETSLEVAPPAIAGAGLQTALPDGASPDADPPSAPEAPCAGGPTIDGITLDQCFVENFTVSGDNVSITVWYTTNPVTATRTEDGTTYTLEHWINTNAQAQQVAAWGRQAWERYHQVFGRHPYIKGCSSNINVRMEDGIGWGGIAYWASSGKCWIGIDSPTVRTGGGQGVVYHEFQHYLQYAYDDGCYAFLKANYDSGSASGDAEYVEGYADLAEDAVDATVDSTGYGGAVGAYVPTTSFFDKSYFDVYNKYYIEQVGTQWTPADPHHHMDAVREHYRVCDVQDTLYVLDDVIPSMTGGELTEELLFLNFFAANWAKDWADATTQPELVYTDDDGNPYGSIALAQNVTISSGSKSWTAQTTPDDWAGRYYQVRPQAGCDYVTVAVDGAAGAHLGINLMAADTTAPTSVSRAGWIGEDFTRTFAGDGVHDRVAAAVNAFANTANYDVSFTCVTPVLDILEPKPRPNSTQVGDPASPIAFLGRFKVTSGATPVLGLLEASFTADAEGDAVTFVPGTFQEVGEEYWAVMMPPTKTVGTTYVDLRVCLDGAICDTNTDALLYVDPGNSDFALLFDASGSMKDEDTPGEGKRIDNARKSGTVLADLLRNGDRIAVMDFSARDIPAGCGLPWGDGNCPLDIQTHLARTDVTGPGTINAARTAIGNISAREWTPIGAGLRDAKNALQAAPYSLNPKIIVLLSDGEENVNPLYSAVRTELVSSGVIIDTIGFSGDAPEPLLAQIAADTGGTYRFVPTTGGTLSEVSLAKIRELEAHGLPSEVAARLMAPLLPGPLGLDDVYDYFETKGQGAARLLHINYTTVPDGAWREQAQFVDDSVNTLRLVVAGKQEDNDVPGYCVGYHRDVEILPPGADPRGWIPVSPPVYATSSPPPPPPPTWDIRNSLYDDVVIIPSPDPGIWKIRSRYRYVICVAGEVDQEATAAATLDLESDFMINASVQSEYRLQGRFLAPIVNNKGKPGDKVPIVATLLSRGGTVPGALVVGAVEKPGAPDFLLLRDDGLNSDGMAGDGIYGAYYGKTNVGGTYNVRLVAAWEDETTGNVNTREWLGAFWIEGPEVNDSDRDGMPDPWERRCRLDPKRNDSEEDPDGDNLINIDEFHQGTLPCDPDTDDGGEQDGSEVAGGRDPLYPPDDLCRPQAHIGVRALNERLLVRWARPQDYTSMRLYLSTEPGQLGRETEVQSTGAYTFTNLLNNQMYYLTVAGVNENALCRYSDPIVVTPKTDPDPPSGWVLINNGAERTCSRNVVLNLSSTDVPLPGMAESANAHVGGGPLSELFNQISGGIQMRIANDPSFAGAAWEPFASQKPWVLGEPDGNVSRVFAQFRDAAGNESLIVRDDILVDTCLYVSPAHSAVAVSHTMTVELRIDNVRDLYGAQVELAFDPTLVEVVDAYDFLPGVQIHEGDFPTPEVTIQNQADNANGRIYYTVSLRGEQPGVSGSGVLARIVFHGRRLGQSPLTFTRSVLSDPQSIPIAHTRQDGVIVVQEAAGLVTGRVILERRASNAGATVCVDGTCANTPADGTYGIPGITPGPHTVTARRMSYLRSWRNVNVPVGVLNLPDVTLLGGDVNQDDEIEVADGALIGRAWNSTPASPNWDERADITDDDNVNVLDMVAVQFNWDEMAPGPWMGAAAGRQSGRAGARPASTGQATQVVIDPSQANLSGVGQTVELDIRVENVADLYAARVKLSFDPSVLRVRDSDPRGSAPGVQIRPGDFLDPINQQILVNSADNTAGTIDFAVTQTYPAVARSGSGLLATVVFEAVGNGSSTVQLTSVRLLDDTQPDPQQIAAGAQNGRVTVGAANRLYMPMILKRKTQ